MLKQKSLLLVSIVVLILIGSGCGTVSKSKPIEKKPESQFGYQVIEDGAKVVFVFDEKIQNKSSVTSVNVAGTFNQWKVSNAWRLEQTSKGIWKLTVPTDETCIPGNSGYAEFKFVVNGSVWVNPLPTTPSGYTFKGNNLIVFAGEGEDIEEIVAGIIAGEKIATTAKRAGDFDPENEEDRKTIANFRLVPETDKLFRSYNPCRESRTYDSEVKRLEYVNEFLESNEVKSIISVSGQYGSPPKYTVSEYMQAIVDGKHFFSSEPSYESVYYESDLAEFRNLIKGVVEFIINPEHDAPFLVHCKIGTDRTGVVSAMIAALCGASWEEICVDYQKSNEAGIEEYRSTKLLQYSLENMLKTKITDEVDLKNIISEYFIEGEYLTAVQIDALNAKLKN